MDIRTSFLDAIDEEAKANWRLDSERSYAEFTYYPDARTGGTVYFFRASLDIKPYPNPLSFGGMWWSGSSKSKAELKKVKDEFMEQVNRFVRYGLTRIEIQKI